MWSPSRNMKSDIHQVQLRIKLLKQRNEGFLKNSKIRNNLNSKQMRSIDKINVDGRGLTQYFSKDEMAAVENCNRKSMELVDRLSRNKKRKKILKNVCTISTSIKNQLKKNIKSNDKIIDNTKIITLYDTDIYSNSPDTSFQLRTCVDKATFSKSDPCQSIQKNACLEKLEDSDVIQLQTTNPAKTIKCQQNRSTNEAASKEMPIKNCKDIHYKSFVPRENDNKLCNNKFSTINVVTNANYFKNNVEKSSQDVIYLKTSQPLESLNINKPNFQKQNYNSKNVSKLEISSSKSNATEISEYSHCEAVQLSKAFHSEQINIEQDYSETIAPVWDFTVEPVDFDIPPLHLNERLSLWPASKINLYRSKGISIKFGRWSEKEIALLHRNYKNFTAEFGINDACLLLGMNRSKDEFKNAMKFWKAKHFLVRLGKDLSSRPLWNIYQKARREFFTPVKRKTYTDKDIEFLMELQEKYGNNWFMISQKFHLTPERCKELFLSYNKDIVLGKWTNEEKKHLINAIKKILKVKNVPYKTFRRLPWEKIAELVPTRTSSQCCNEWHRNSAALRKIWQDTY